MRTPRRLVAATTALAVAWTALWPLVSSAQHVAAGEAMPLCHQAGMQVDPDVAPADPAPAKGEAKQHCPLCVMAFYTGTSAPVVAPTPPESPTDRAREPHCAPVPGGTQTSLPQSRAPPALS